MQSEYAGNAVSRTGRLRPHLMPVFLLLFTVCMIYAQALGHDFLFNWDDYGYVAENNDVRGFTWGHLRAAFTGYYLGNYAPLHIISYMFDYTVWGMKPAGFILTNILLHALNGLLYYALLIRITGRRMWAFLAAFIFISHPVQVESVAWISQRKNVLAMSFFLVSFLLYIRYRDAGLGSQEAGCGTRDQENTTQNSKPKTQNLFYAGSIVAFLLSISAKSVAVILPVVLSLYDLCYPAKDRCNKHLANKIPYIAVAAIFALMALKSQSPEVGGGRTGYHGGSPLATFFTMLPVFMHYLGMLFWPVNLSAAYNPLVRTGPDGLVAISAILLALLGVCTFFLYQRRRDLFFWIALFFIGLLPVSQIVPLVTLINDRYCYFPMLGAAALVAGAAVSAMDSLSAPYRKTVTAIIGLLLISLPVLSFNRSKVWQDSMTLWTDAYDKYPASVAVCRLLAGAYEKTGNPGAALSLYQRALSIAPLDRSTLYSISVFHVKNEEFTKAWPHLTTLVNTYPEFVDGYVVLGNYYLGMGNLYGAEAVYKNGLKAGPSSNVLHRNLGLVNFLLGKNQLAREYYHKALMLGDETAELRYDLACLESVSGRTADALGHLEAALESGYKDIDLILKNDELDPLRKLPKFQMLLDKYLRR